MRFPIASPGLPPAFARHALRDDGEPPLIERIVPGEVSTVEQAGALRPEQPWRRVPISSVRRHPVQEPSSLRPRRPHHCGCSRGVARWRNPPRRRLVWLPACPPCPFCKRITRSGSRARTCGSEKRTIWIWSGRVKPGLTLWIASSVRGVSPDATSSTKAMATLAGPERVALGVSRSPRESASPSSPDVCGREPRCGQPTSNQRVRREICAIEPLDQPGIAFWVTHIDHGVAAVRRHIAAYNRALLYGGDRFRLARSRRHCQNRVGPRPVGINPSPISRPPDGNALCNRNAHDAAAK